MTIAAIHPIPVTMNIDAIQAIWDAQSHQRSPTPLGVFGKLPLEVRNQVYREFFVRLLVFLKRQDRNKHSQTCQLFASLMRSSKALRTETEPLFYQYCQFCFYIGLHREEKLVTANRILQRVIPLMQRIVLETRYSRDVRWFHQGEGDFVAVLPMKDLIPLRLPEFFSKTSSQGRQMELHITGNSHMGFWTPRDTANPALFEVFHPFRHFHTVIFYVDLESEESGSTSLASLRPRAEQCVKSLRASRSTLEPVLGPGTTVVKDRLRCFGAAYRLYNLYETTVYHPRSYLAAKERQKERQNTSD